MPKRSKDITHYSRYFRLEAPSVTIQTIIVIVIGILAGITSTVLIHQYYGKSIASIISSGATSGVIIISLPAMLTAMLVKAMKRKLQFKHAFFAVTAVTAIYAILIIVDSLLFALLHNYVIAYVALLLINAGIYGYWFIINRVVMNQKRSQTLTAAIHPVLNVLFYIPMSKYLLNLDVPVDIVLVKLWSGMLVFMIFGYIILYLMDRPAKRVLNISGVDVISAMAGQVLYNITRETGVFTQGDAKRDMHMNMLALKGKKGYKAIFVKPDIHYGPFQDIGGSITTAHIGKQLARTYNATPFILHGAVSMEDNPINRNQIYKLSNEVIKKLDTITGDELKSATGYFTMGYDKPCKAMNIKIGDVSLLTLTKAPYVTEDINREIGIAFENKASKKNQNIMLIDAHNSRFESAGEAELSGISKGSKYIPKYENAINYAMNAKGKKQHKMRFGSSCRLIKRQLNNIDLGNGYTSLGIFDFGGKRLCIVYFDANNMLPGFRDYVISQISEKFGMEAEVYTTDTHAVNTLTMPASNVLGRYTKPSRIMPIVEEMVREAESNVEEVKYAYVGETVRDFGVWGEGSEAKLRKTVADIVNTAKRKVPIIIAGAFIVSAWVIYVL